MKFGFLAVVLFVSCNMCLGQDTLKYDKEKHLKNVRQITFGGDNAEGYWSFDDKKIIFQSTNKRWGVTCDQIYLMDFDNQTDGIPPMVSTGLGRTTCSFFMPDNKSVVYASTHEGDKSCPHVPGKRDDGKYVWPIYDSYDIYHSDINGNLIAKLTDSPGYDAEATVSPLGDKIVFTSTRNGDLDLYTMNLDGSDVRQVTSELGYDGGAFFSPDGKQLIFRASRPKTEEDIKVYTDLLAQGLVMPTEMELFICNTDGSGLRQITKLGKANWAPYFHPKGEKILFSSNHHSKRGYQFNLFMINTDGTGLEQVTFDPVFDSFPMFSYDGTKLVFASNRNNKGTRDTNLFIAEWED